MTVERHLMLQEFTLPPATERFPSTGGWTIVRVAEGSGYWLQHDMAARELDAGDVLVAPPKSNGVIRASAIGSVKLQYFFIQPELLGGLLTVMEWQQLESAGGKTSPPVFAFPAGEPLAQKFSELAEASMQGSLPVRCRCLELWADAVVTLMRSTPNESNYNTSLRERFRQLIGQVPTAELSTRTLEDLAQQLGCSERHFRRLFREEFGIPLRKRQTELRLQRAKQLLTDSDDKIINVAYESGYHHLGLFNSSFKKHFGMTPGQWRQHSRKTVPERPRRTGRMTTLLVTLGVLFHVFLGFGQTNAPARPADTNAPVQTFTVDHYDVQGNTLLKQAEIDAVMKPGTGTNVSFERIVKTLNALQTDYRERGYMTVAVTLPQQQLTNAVVKVRVTEAPLVAINIVNNHHYSDANIRRALPDIKTNIMLNSFVFQRELDNANANRDRQIYPSVGPGPEPGTSALTLRVKDRFPLHARLEVNNQSTPNTPDLRANFNAQYDNVWGHDHQVGFQYGFTPEAYSDNTLYQLGAFDKPLIVNYSAYYRIPLGSPSSVQDQIEGDPMSFGYNEASHKFNLPPNTGRPELTIFASRSVNDTGVTYGPRSNVVSTPLLSIDQQDTGENVTLNEGVGARLTIPLRQIKAVSSTLTLGVDFKQYNLASFNTNNFYATTSITNSDGSVSTITDTFPTGQPPLYSEIVYLPFDAGLSGSVADKLGTTFYSVTVNFSPLDFITDKMHHEGLTTNVPPSSTNYVSRTGNRSHYVTVTGSLSREQKVYKDWTVMLRANGQWADGPLFSNEQFPVGGIASVRGYHEGQVYGDSGWRVSVEPRTPFWNLGNFTDSAHTEALWARAWTFFDYGEAYTVGGAPGVSRIRLASTGFGGMMGIANNFDARVTVAWPLITNAGEKAGQPGVFFSLGIQF